MSSTSPSVYVIYTRLMAVIEAQDSKNCPSTNVGTAHDLATVAYDPTALSTGHCYHTDWSPVNYTQLYYPQPDNEVATRANCFGPTAVVEPGDKSSHVLEGMPLLSMPPGLSRVDPLWSGYAAGSSYGGYDPPIALTKASAMAPPVSAQSIPESRSSAQPASSVVNRLPTATSTMPGKGRNTQQIRPTASSGDMVVGDPVETPNSVKHTWEALSPSDPNEKYQGSQDLGTDKVASTGTLHEDPKDEQNSIPPATFTSESGIISESPSSLQNEAAGIGKLISGDPLVTSYDSTHSRLHIDQSNYSPASMPAGAGASKQQSLSLHSEDPSLDHHTKLDVPHPAASSGAEGLNNEASGGSGLPSAAAKVPADDLDKMSPHEAADGGLLLQGSSTLSPGTRVTYSGHLISVGSGVVIADGASYSWATQSSSSDIPPLLTLLPPTTPASAMNFLPTETQDVFNTKPEITQPPVLSFAGSTYTADSSSDFVIDGKTLRPGSAISVFFGAVISMDARASVVLVSGPTQTLSPNGSDISGTKPVVFESSTQSAMMTTSKLRLLLLIITLQFMYYNLSTSMEIIWKPSIMAVKKLEGGYKDLITQEM